MALESVYIDSIVTYLSIKYDITITITALNRSKASYCTVIIKGPHIRLAKNRNISSLAELKILAPRSFHLDI